MVRLPPRLRPLFPYLKPAYVTGTRSVAPVSVLLSRRRGHWLPAGVAPTMEQAAARSGGRCVTARAAERIERPPMQGHPAGTTLADRRDGARVERVAVAELPGGRVLGPHRAVITGTGELVQDVSWYFGTRRPREHPLFLNPFPGPPLELDGRVGVLAARGDGNYYHFLMDVLTRLGVLEQAPDIAAPQRWYVPQRHRFQRELLDLFGIGAAQRIDADTHRHVRAETLVVAGPPAMVEKNPPWAVQFLRSRLIPAAAPTGGARRLYVTRGSAANNRVVVNEPAVLALLRERGFERIDPGALSVREQVSAFSGAELVVSPHGAAMTNLVFLPSGAGIVELFPAGCVLPDFWRLACGVPGLRYRYLSAHGGPRRPTRAGTIVRDIRVDLDALAATLDELA